MIKQAFGLNLTGSLVPGQNTVIMIAGTLLSPQVFSDVVMPDSYFPLWISWHDAADKHSVGAVADKIVALIRQSKFGRTLLVGHSSGGTIAMLVCLKLKGEGLLNGLLLCNTGASNQGHANIQSAEQMIANWNEQALDAFLQNCFARPIPNKLYPLLKAYGMTISAQTRVEPLVSQRETDLVERLHEIDLPTVIAYGTLDHIRTLHHAQELQREIPGATLILLDAGHTPMVEDSAGFSKALALLAKRADGEPASLTY